MSLVLQLNQPPFQLVPGSLCLLPQLLLPLQTLPLYLTGGVWTEKRGYGGEMWTKTCNMDEKTMDR